MKTIEAILGISVMLVNIYIIFRYICKVLKNECEKNCNKLIQICMISLFSLKFIRSKFIIFKIISLILLSINLKLYKSKQISIGD